MGVSTEFLKGSVVKLFPLREGEEQLVHTVSGNLLHHNKKTNEIKFTFKMRSTTAVFLGEGVVELTEKVKGIIFDSTNTNKVQFADDLRAEELMVALEISVEGEIKEEGGS